MEKIRAFTKKNPGFCVFSLLALAGSFSMPVGLLIGSPVAEWVGLHMWFLISGIGIILITAAGIAAQWLLQRSRDA